METALVISSTVAMRQY